MIKLYIFSCQRIKNRKFWEDERGGRNIIGNTLGQLQLHGGSQSPHDHNAESRVVTCLWIITQNIF